jgi:hypothetical protein
MKSYFRLAALLSAIGFFGFFAAAQIATKSLAQAADRVIAEGKQGNLPIGFARYMGINTKQRLPLKRIQIEQNGATNIFNVLLDNSNNIILSERKHDLTTFYLTDRAGTLRRAVVIDSAVAEGGITNLTLNAAAAGFAKQKILWLSR